MPEDGKSREAGWARLLLLLRGVVGAVVVWSAADIFALLGWVPLVCGGSQILFFRCELGERMGKDG